MHIPHHRCLRTGRRSAGMAAFLLLALSLGCAPAQRASTTAPASEGVGLYLGATTTVQHPALYPETVVYRPKVDRFLMSSLREGGVFEVTRTGEVRPLVRSPRLVSVLGIAVDEDRNRLWAVTGDLGAGVRASAEGARKMAAVGVYDLTTGEELAFVDLTSTYVGPHLLNGIALDADGSAYVTDSFSPVIYKVDADGSARVFARDARFAGEGISLNGIVVHPDGYVLVVKKSDGTLFKIPLDQPETVATVNLGRKLEGGDGLLLLPGATRLVVVANQVPTATTNAVFALSSSDGFRSAVVDDAAQLGDVYPTTATLAGDTIYVLYSKLNQLIQAPAEQKGQMRGEATVQEIGKIRHTAGS